MRGTTVFVAGWVSVAAVLVATLSGCDSDNNSDTAVGSTTSTTTAAAAQADGAAVRSITEAYTTFFNGTTPAERKAALVQDGSVFLPILQAQAASPQAGGTTVTVSSVHLTGPAAADVTYTLLLGGNPVLPNQTGQAVKIGSDWKVATATFCALMTLQGGTSPAC